MRLYHFLQKLIQSFLSRHRRPSRANSQTAASSGSSRTSEVMVAALRSAHQLEVCLAHRFYHIPQEQVRGKDMSSVRYLAIFQSRQLFREEAGVRYLGEVTGCRLVPRNTITQIPSKSTRLYYQIQLREWTTLARPIEPKEDGFVVSFTSLALLERAAETPQLWLRTPEEFRLYDVLQALHIRLAGTPNPAPIHINGQLILVSREQNKLVLRRGDQIFYICETQEFRHAPGIILEEIRHCLSRLETQAAKIPAR